MIPRLFCLFILSCLLAEAAEPLTLKLWPEGSPGKMLPPSQATQEFVRTKAGKSALTNIAEPTITVYRPEKPIGTTVIVAPGGGYVFLSAMHEGTQVCEWLNSIGVTGVLLKYRTPTRDEAAPHEKPVADAAKAIALVREHAKEWSLDPNRVGLLGFSAGGNLLAHITCDRDWSGYPMNADQMKNSSPNFGIMIYGGGFVDSKDPTKLKTGFTVPADAPPLFMACASDDGQNPLAATALYLEYKKQNLPAELHLFTKGGHGFGIRDNKQPINAWPQRCAEWMDAMGWLPTPEKLTVMISDREQKIAAIAKKIKEATVCADDVLIMMNDQKVLSQKLQEAQQKGDKLLAQKLTVDLDIRQKALATLQAELDKKSFNPEKLIDELNEHKKAIYELQAQRDILLKHKL